MSGCAPPGSLATARVRSLLSRCSWHHSHPLAASVSWTAASGSEAAREYCSHALAATSQAVRTDTSETHSPPRTKESFFAENDPPPGDTAPSSSFNIHSVELFSAPSDCTHLQTCCKPLRPTSSPPRIGADGALRTTSQV